MSSQQDISPKRSLSKNPKINPLFLPTTRPYPLNTLTHGLPPMYWLGTSRWCLGPLCMFHFVWICFFLTFTPFSTASMFVWFYCTSWLVFISCGMKDVWAFGLMFPSFHPFLGLDIAWVKTLIFLPSPCSFLSCVWGPLSCGFYYTTSSCLLWFYLSFYFLLPHGLTGWCSCRASPLLYQFFAQGFLGPLSTSLPLLGFIGQHSYCASPFHYLIPWASLAHLLIFLPLLLSWAFC